jgi:hypothetical protein
MNINDFVFIKDNALSEELCDSLVKDFTICEQNKLTTEGLSRHGIDYNIKRSTDLNLFQHSDIHKKYTSKIAEIFNKILSEEYLVNLPYNDKFTANTELFYGRTYYELINLQKYSKLSGHYNAWHVETGDFDMSKKLFTFLVYLNDIEKGGQTEFLYSNFKIQPKKGKLIIFPSSFPYVYRENIPLSNDKYILNAWLSYTP